MIRNILLVLMLLTLPMSALAIPVTSLDRMCNVDLNSIGANGYSDGMCITSASNNMNVHEDIACWYSAQNNTIFTTWIGGNGDTGSHPRDPNGAAGSCTDWTTKHAGNAIHIEFRDDDTSQSPNLVFDNGAMPYLGTDEPASCDCACPIPTIRDGVATGGGWTNDTKFNNWSENASYFIIGSMGADTVWSYRAAASSNREPVVSFYGYLGDDTFITYGRMLTGTIIHALSDLYDDSNWWGAGGSGNDTVWAGSQEQAGTSMYSSLTYVDTYDGNDHFWLNDFTNKIPGSTWNLGAGGTDETTAHGAPLTSNEDSQVALPAMPACPAWIQGGVANGAYPGMQP